MCVRERSGDTFKNDGSYGDWYMLLIDHDSLPCARDCAKEWNEFWREVETLQTWTSWFRKYDRDAFFGIDRKGQRRQKSNGNYVIHHWDLTVDWLLWSKSGILDFPSADEDYFMSTVWFGLLTVLPPRRLSPFLLITHSLSSPAAAGPHSFAFTFPFLLPWGPSCWSSLSRPPPMPTFLLEMVNFPV